MSTPLFIRSVYTLLSSMCQIDGIVSKCAEYGYKSCALVDRNVLSGAMAFKRACKKSGIKPVYGMEIEVNALDRNFPLMLLARDDEGFKNLMALSSIINTGEEKTVNGELVNKHKDHNFVILFSDNMPLSFAFEKGEDCEELLLRQKEIFGDYLVAMADHDVAFNLNRDRKLKPFLKSKGIKTVGLSRVFYPSKDDCQEYEILKCIRDKKTLKESNGSYDENRYLLNEKEMSQLYDEDDLLNSDVISSLCNVYLDFKTELPSYPVKEGTSSKDYLVNLCRYGLRRRLNNHVNQLYTDRLEYELKTIIRMHFEDYFLIVYDFILFAKKNGILVGPGRGSAAGSLVSYCLGITDIDPIRYGLMFERFLNPERISMPDIDTDFPDDKRDLVINYVREKYGIEHVGHIIAYGTLKAKQVLRDVGRVLEYPVSDIDSVNKLIPFAYANSLKAAYENVPIFKQKIESEERFRKLYRTALKLEGCPRHESTHAAGIVFSKKPLTEIVPLIKIEEDINSTQYTMEYLEELGLIKMDFLGLRNLSIIDEIVREINRHESLDIRKIPLNDEKTFKLIKDINLLGVFQLESSGMQNLARRMQPRSFEELSMMIALFRPGPMENIPVFLEYRAHPEKIEYLSDELKPILEETYGIIVYQEQIMAIARKMAGFSLGKADLLRRAMSKKKAEELMKLSSDFIEGCMKNGHSRELAEKIYELILRFANYGFNKSHSVAYGMIAYQMAYLKANYPLYFYKALLNGAIGSEIKTYEYIHECESAGNKVKAISLNRSGLNYIIEDNAIIMPFGVCKDVGSISAAKIIEERERKGPYKNYLDAILRLTEAGIERNVTENLIYAGAFDEFEYSRYTMIKGLDNALKYAANHRGLTLDLGYDDSPAITVYKDDMLILSEYEKKVLGFCFSYNPIAEIKRQNAIETLSIREISNSEGYNKGFGLVKRVKSHRTRNGQLMAFADISDDSGDMSLVIMPNLYQGIQSDLVKGVYVYFEGNIEKEASCLVRKIRIIKGEL